MSATPDGTQPWIADEPPAYELVNRDGRSRAVLACDHASPVSPRRLGAPSEARWSKLKDK